MTVQRGSTSQIAMIAEVTPGTTPATPTLLQMPVASYQPKSTLNLIKSAQIRAHPFVDQIAQGRLDHSYSMDVELAGAVHDPLLQVMFGSTITSKSMKFVDNLSSMSFEETVASGVYNAYTYGVLSQLQIQCSASDTAPVKMSFQGMARAASLDAAATIATGVTPATSTTPFTFAGASATLNAVATPVGSGSIQIQRQIDPLVVLGSVLPREYVPGAVTITGSITVPYDASGVGGLGATHSAFLTGFTNVPQVWKFASSDGSVYRQLTIPQTNYSSLGRSLTSRGARMQEINWEAKYDTSSTTAVTLATQ